MACFQKLQTRQGFSRALDRGLVQFDLDVQPEGILRGCLGLEYTALPESCRISNDREWRKVPDFIDLEGFPDLVEMVA